MRGEFAIEKVNNKVRNASVTNEYKDGERKFFAHSTNRLFPIPLFSFSKDLNSIMKIICLYIISQAFTAANTATRAIV